MENRKLKLPTGIQTFEKLRDDNCVYVDKTQYMVDIIDNINVCFLARPRRFGKSLTASTFEALFSGKKELFKGLYAEEYLNRPDFKPSPVIYLDMSMVTTNEGIEGIKESINFLTQSIANRLQINLSNTKISGILLNELITQTAEKYKSKVVVLVDEYDAPYTDFVNDSDMAKAVREVLRNFYVHLKANEKHIRFIFITGISKFAKFGVFSTLNNTTDISLMPEYAEICGYSEDEILRYFPDYLEDAANSMEMNVEDLLEKMRHYYNGFSFDRKAHARLYNPFSTLSFFKEQEFYNYWIDTGRSKMIADYLKTRNLTVEQFRNFQITKDFSRNPGDMDATTPEGFLYQCGYLSLRPGISNDLSLDYPNTEVLNSMSKLLTQNIVTENEYNNFQNDLFHALVLKDVEKLVEILNRLLANIPYDDFTHAAKQSIYINNYKFPAQEWLYRSTTYAFLRGCGIVVSAELHSNLGRADLVISHKGTIWVIELKVAYEGQNPEEKAEEALQQIIKKNYAKQYPDAVSLGLAIDDATRQITDFRVIRNS